MKVVPERVLTYQKDTRFKQSPTVESSPWHEIMPLGADCVRLTPSEYADVNGVHLPDQGTQEFCISAFRQIHCFATLKHILDNFRSGEAFETLLGGLDPVQHADHCFDYPGHVRSSICALKNGKLIVNSRSCVQGMSVWSQSSRYSANRMEESPLV
jgi:hypothetical protein